MTHLDEEVYREKHKSQEPQGGRKIKANEDRREVRCRTATGYKHTTIKGGESFKKVNAINNVNKRKDKEDSVYGRVPGITIIP